jgi:hypothetical protein
MPAALELVSGDVLVHDGYVENAFVYIADGLATACYIPTPLSRSISAALSTCPTWRARRWGS